MAHVSFSQYSKWASCPRQYKHHYIDKLSESDSNINLIFGQAMHSTLQNFLSVFYTVTKTAAMNMDLDTVLLKFLMEEFTKEKEKSNKPPCTREEIEEFYNDGVLILKYFKSHLPRFFSKKGYELIAIELPLRLELKTNVNFEGFIDVIIKEIATGEFTIIDFKTSTKGWGKYQKKDPVKNSQLLLYKMFYAKLFNTTLDKINVEFIILKRKLIENTDYTIPRISKHIPANGKISTKKAWTTFAEFVDMCFDEEGNRVVDIEYPKKPSKLCEWCEFYKRNICDGK